MSEPNLPDRTQEVREAVGVLLSALEDAARTRPEVQQSLGTVAQWINEHITQPATEEAAEPAALAEAPDAADRVGGSTPSTTDAPADVAVARPPTAPVSEDPLGPAVLKIGDESATVLVPGGLSTTGPVAGNASTSAAGEPRGSADGVRWAKQEIDLESLCEALRLKAKACRWVAEHGSAATLADLPAHAETERREILALAKQPEAGRYLWVFDPRRETPSQADAMDVCECYLNLAMALELAQAVDDSGATDGGKPLTGVQLREVLQLVAEAQSALRIAMMHAARIPDEDQQQAFNWLRRQARDRHVFLPRFMKIDDQAAPDHWPSLRERLNELDNQWREQTEATVHRDRLLKKATYHVDQIMDCVDPAELSRHWSTLCDTLDALVSASMQPSSLEIRDLIWPVLDLRPDTFDFEVKPGADRVFREVDRYLDELAERQDEADEAGPQGVRPQADVQRVATWLKGRDMVLVGGDERPAARAAIERAFGLNELRWVAQGPHAPHNVFEPQVARPETALVALAIRWASHSYQPALRELCQKHGKPYVRLPRGYNVNQIARSVVEQVSDRFRDQTQAESS